ncbi:calcium-binding protein [Thioclava sp. A2]|uniref:calcium-binding protein n=1 Tax=Thioclava sp. FCG-A2 TaxID=3080562 RepID=UPI00295323C8|nr:calcium-binding protein [Thioclava sp. A2]MDV7272151.1 calcium-binding protein [Thioclava sp. A2]
MGLVFGGRFASGVGALDRGILDLFVVQEGGSTRLYSIGGANGGVVSYALTGGRLLVLDTDYYSSSDLVDPVAPMLLPLASGVLVYGATDAGDLVGLNLSSAGIPGQTTTIQMPSDGIAGPQSAILTTSLNNGQTALYAIDQAQGGLHLYLQGASGWMASGQNYAFQSVGPDAGDALLDNLRVGNSEFLLAATSFSDSVAVFRISGTTGALTQTDSLGSTDGLGINTPTAMETFTAFGSGWVVLAASDSNSLSVMRLGADGTLTPADHVIDSLHTRFAGLTALSAVTVGERVYLVAGGADDGISLFTLLPDGRLVHLQTLVNAGGLGLDNVQSIETALVGEALQIVVASGTQAGLSLFTLDLSGSGAFREASGLVAGSSGDDLLVAGGTSDTLQGGAGDDILASGAGRTVMTGGTGSDLFVLRPSGQRQIITDFTPGADSLDLTNWPLLRNIGQLSVATSGASLILGFNGNSVEIRSGTGQALTLADIFPDQMLGALDHMPLFNLDDWVEPDLPPEPGPDSGSIALPVVMSMPAVFVPPISVQPADLTRFRQVYGSARSEKIVGFSGADLMRGGGGNDTLVGAAGADRLIGGDGNDRIFAGIGADTIWGGIGGDAIAGGAGNDLIRGEAGHDLLWGGGGDDTLIGGVGGDRLWGGYGGDILYGWSGNDTLWAGAGNDLALGGLGYDAVWGGSGSDTISGGYGNDLLGGGADNDYVMGNAGADTIWGGDGHDMIWGGVGNDLVGAGAGDDYVEGGDGDDRIWGAAGRDTILGGAGQDSLWGAYGEDLISGGNGNDTLGGGAGTDTLVGDGGDDLLFGGGDADVFVFSGSFGNDRIEDFEIGSDRLAFDAPFGSVEDLAIIASGANTVIHTVAGTITLTGISPDSLSTDSFIFGWDSL